MKQQIVGWAFTMWDIVVFVRNSANSKGYDLNRNFPDYFKQNTKRTQPETEAVKDWISKIQFLLSGSLHGGALVRLHHLQPFLLVFIAWNISLPMTIDLLPIVNPDFHLFLFRLLATHLITLRMPVSIHS